MPERTLKRRELPETAGSDRREGRLEGKGRAEECSKWPPPSRWYRNGRQPATIGPQRCHMQRLCAGNREGGGGARGQQAATAASLPAGQLDGQAGSQHQQNQHHTLHLHSIHLPEWQQRTIQAVMYSIFGVSGVSLDWSHRGPPGALGAGRFACGTGPVAWTFCAVGHRMPCLCLKLIQIKQLQLPTTQ